MKRELKSWEMCGRKLVNNFCNIYRHFTCNYVERFLVSHIVHRWAVSFSSSYIVKEPHSGKSREAQIKVLCVFRERSLLSQKCIVASYLERCSLFVASCTAAQKEHVMKNDEFLFFLCSSCTVILPAFAAFITQHHSRSIIVCRELTAGSLCREDSVPKY